MVNWAEIERIAKAHHRAVPTASEENIVRFLTDWYCAKFNAPRKDPVLASYTTEELYYEWLRHEYLRTDPDAAAEQAKGADDDAEWVKKTLAKIQAEKPRDSEPLDELPDIKTSFED